MIFSSHFFLFDSKFQGTGNLICIKFSSNNLKGSKSFSKSLNFLRIFPGNVDFVNFFILAVFVAFKDLTRKGKGLELFNVIKLCKLEYFGHVLEMRSEKCHQRQ